MTVHLEDFHPNPPETQQFRVVDDSTAAWAMRKLHGIRTRQAEARRIAKTETDRINSWLESTLSSMESDEAFFSSHLTAYMRQQRETQDRKTINLPHGRIRSRSVQQKFIVTDESKFIDWAIQSGHSELVRVKEEVDMAAVKLTLLFGFPDTETGNGNTVIDPATGEVAPGLAAISEDVSYTVEVDLD
jgi:phage host-nuclease inhibitor protein Gam